MQAIIIKRRKLCVAVQSRKDQVGYGTDCVPGAPRLQELEACRVRPRLRQGGVEGVWECAATLSIHSTHYLS